MVKKFFKLVEEGNKKINLKNSTKTLGFKPIVATSLAVALCVSVGNAQGPDSNGYYYAGGSTQDTYAANKGGNSDPWGTISEVNGVKNTNWISDWSNNTSTDFQAKNIQINVNDYGMIQFKNVTATMTLENSFLNFSDQGSGGAHGLSVNSQSGKITAEFRGGIGTKTVRDTTYHNVAFYGGMIFHSTASNPNQVTFSNGANMLGGIVNLAEGGTTMATVTFIGGGNLIATDQTHYISSDPINIQNTAINLKTKSTSSSQQSDQTQNIIFGESNKVEVADASILDSNGVINSSNLTSIATIDTSSIGTSLGDKTIITNTIKGNLIAQGLWASTRLNAVGNITFNNNGRIEGNITAKEYGYFNITFVRNGTIQGILKTTAGSNTVNFNGSNGSINSINGNITSTGGSNTVNFSRAINSTNSINGSISTNSGGTNTITATGTTLNILGDIIASNQTSETKNLISADTLILSSSSIYAGEAGGMTTKNTFEVTNIDFGNNLTITANNNYNNGNAKTNIFKITGNINGNQAISDLNSIVISEDNNIDKTANILSFEGSNNISLEIVNINNSTTVGDDKKTGYNYIGSSLTQGSGSTLALSFAENNWNTDTYKASNLSLSITENIYAKYGKNYINVGSLSVGGEIDGNAGTNNIAIASDFIANIIKARWGGSNNIFIEGNATIASISAGDGGSNGTNTLTFSGANSSGIVTGNISINSGNGNTKQNIFALSGLNSTLALRGAINQITTLSGYNNGGGSDTSTLILDGANATSNVNATISSAITSGSVTLNFNGDETHSTNLTLDAGGNTIQGITLGNNNGASSNNTLTLSSGKTEVLNGVNIGGANAQSLAFSLSDSTELALTGGLNTNDQGKTTLALTDNSSATLSGGSIGLTSLILQGDSSSTIIFRAIDTTIDTFYADSATNNITLGNDASDVNVTLKSMGGNPTTLDTLTYTGTGSKILTINSGTSTISTITLSNTTNTLALNGGSLTITNAISATSGQTFNLNLSSDNTTPSNSLITLRDTISGDGTKNVTFSGGVADQVHFSELLLAGSGDNAINTLTTSASNAKITLDSTNATISTLSFQNSGSILLGFTGTGNSTLTLSNAITVGSGQALGISIGGSGNRNLDVAGNITFDIGSTLVVDFQKTQEGDNITATLGSNQTFNIGDGSYSIINLHGGAGTSTLNGTIELIDGTNTINFIDTATMGDVITLTRGDNIINVYGSDNIQNAIVGTMAVSKVGGVNNTINLENFSTLHLTDSNNTADLGELKTTATNILNFNGVNATLQGGFGAGVGGATTGTATIHVKNLGAKITGNVTNASVDFSVVDNSTLTLQGATNTLNTLSSSVTGNKIILDTALNDSVSAEITSAVANNSSVGLKFGAGDKAKTFKFSDTGNNLSGVEFDKSGSTNNTIAFTKGSNTIANAFSITNRQELTIALGDNQTDSSYTEDGSNSQISLALTGGFSKNGGSANLSVRGNNTADALISGGAIAVNSLTMNATTSASLTLKNSSVTIDTLTAQSASNTLKLDATDNAVNTTINNTLNGSNLTITLAGGSATNTAILNLSEAGNTINTLSLGANSTNNTLALNNGLTTINNVVNVGANQGIAFDLANGTNLTFTQGITTAESGMTTFNLGSSGADTTTTTIIGALSNSGENIFNVNSATTTLKYGDSGLGFSSGNNKINFEKDNSTLNWQSNAATSTDITTSETAKTTINFNSSNGILASGVSTDGNNTVSTIKIADGKSGTIKETISTTNGATTSINFDNVSENNTSFLNLQGANTNTITSITSDGAGDSILTLDTTSNAVSAEVSKAISGSNLTIALGGNTNNKAELTLNNADNKDSTIQTLGLSGVNSNVDKNILNLQTRKITITNGIGIDSTQGLTINLAGAELESGITNAGNTIINFNSTDNTTSSKLTGNISTSGNSKTTTLNVATSGNGVINGNITLSEGGVNNVAIGNGGTLTLQGANNQLTSVTSTTSGILSLDGKGSTSGVNANISNAITGNTTTLNFNGTNDKTATLTLENSKGNSALKAITLESGGATDNILTLQAKNTSIDEWVNIGETKGITFNLDGDSSLAFTQDITNLNASANGSANLVFNIQGGDTKTNTISGNITTGDDSVRNPIVDAFTTFNVTDSSTGIIKGNIFTKNSNTTNVVIGNSGTLALRGQNNTITAISGYVASTPPAEGSRTLSESSTLILDGANATANGDGVSATITNAIDRGKLAINFNGNANNIAKLTLSTGGNTLEDIALGNADNSSSTNNTLALSQGQTSIVQNVAISANQALAFDLANGTTLTFNGGLTTTQNGVATFNLGSSDIASTSTTISGTLSNSGENIFNVNSATTTLKYGENGLGFSSGNNKIIFEKDNSTLNWQNNDGTTTQAITTTGGNTQINFKNSGIISGGVSTSNSGNTTIAISGGETATINNITSQTYGISTSGGATFINFNGSTGTLESNVSTTTGSTTFNLGSNVNDDSNSITATITGTITNTDGTQDAEGQHNGGENIFAIKAKNVTFKNGDSNSSFANGLNIIEFANTNGATLTWQDGSGNAQAIKTTGGNTEINFTNNGTINGGVSTNGGSTEINIENSRVANISTLNTSDNGATFINFNGSTGTLESAVSTSGGSTTLDLTNGKTATITGSMVTSGGNTEISFAGDSKLSVSGGISTTKAGTTNINIADNAIATIDGDITTGAIPSSDGANFFSARNVATTPTTNIVFKSSKGNKSTLILQGSNSQITILTMGAGENILALTERGSEGEATRSTRRKVMIDNVNNTAGGKLKLVSQINSTSADTFLINGAILTKTNTEVADQEDSITESNYTGHIGLVLEKGTNTDQIGKKAPVLVATVKKDSGIEFEKTSKIIDGFLIKEADFITPDTNAQGEEVENGNYTSYLVGSVVTDGIVVAEKEITATAFALNYDLYMANLNSLNKRMGELRENTHSQGMWARVFNGALSNDFGLGSKSNYTTIQAGYDYAFGFEGANNYLGIALSYALSTSTNQKAFDKDGQIREIGAIYSHAAEAALYNSYVSDSGWYNDSIAKFSYIMSNFNVDNLNNNTSTSNDTSNFALTFSNEVGYIFKLGENKDWSITPQVEATFGYFNQSNFKQTLADNSDFLNSTADAVLTLRARAGSAFAYDFKNFTQQEGFNASLYIGAFYEYDYVSGGNITMTTKDGTQNNELSDISSDGRVVVNVGTNMTIQDNTRLYFDFEKSFAGKINTDYQVNFGVRYSFGESNGYTPILETTEYKAPLKVDSEESKKESSEINGDNEEQKSKEAKNTENKTQEDKKVEKTESKEEKDEDKKSQKTSPKDAKETKKNKGEDKDK